MAELVITGLSVTASDGAALVKRCDSALRAGELVALVGPNGAGKSSLVRALAGVTAYAGSARLGGEEIARMPPLPRARRIAWLPQTLPPAWPVTVRDAVALGRFAYGGTPGRLAKADARAVELALATCDVAALADRRVTTLSGGELARVHLARALAAETPVLLADEPTAALDLAHRWDLMRVLRAEAAQGRIVLVVVHDLALPARWADRVLVMADGEIGADGPPAAVLTPECLASVFGIDAGVNLVDGRPVISVTGTVAAAAG